MTYSDSIDDAAGPARVHELRAEPRETMLLVAQMRRADGRSLEVKVRNLSPGGMMAECPLSLSRGELVEVALGGAGMVAGSIAWTAGGRAGVAFARPIDPRLARKPAIA